MRYNHLLLACLLALAIAPGTWLRTEIPLEEPSFVEAIATVEVGKAQAGPLVLEHAWEITGSGPLFGGFSALLSLPDDQFVAGSDAGAKLVFTRPDRRGTLPRLTRFGGDDDPDKNAVDLESLTRDPETGWIWGGYEWDQAIRRFDPDYVPRGKVRPRAMADWGSNSGAEALIRLPDGNFLVIEEGSFNDDTVHHQALLFAGDPFESRPPELLFVNVPEDYRPVDMTQLDDHRIAVLLRGFEFDLPPRFSTAIAVMDIADIAPGATVDLHLVAELGEDFPADNYEGMAVTRDAGKTYLWLMSDDNFMQYQRTLLLKLLWQTREKARE
ncbi:esterase-like activity of phytase family protein [Qipengyuania qiaonensis]|uniref:Esterase-like activity of phytase family protein n=1 Tax=Qipengyuania qiaonensis TaxID=2867240 RepID=A0ABS7J4B7_9SPHN|nr:esterase-like activity of phytase family protein [Qipengyuania qiaonensis]MBX7482180.1 esterase-like activity of phytase family protein [Qipengyuania qiaonensis]